MKSFVQIFYRVVSYLRWQAKMAEKNGDKAEAARKRGEADRMEDK